MPTQPQLWPQESMKHPLPLLPVHFIFFCSICLGGKPVISEIIFAPLQVEQRLTKAATVPSSVLPVPLQIGHFCHIIYALSLVFDKSKITHKVVFFTTLRKKNLNDKSFKKCRIRHIWVISHSKYTRLGTPK